MAKIIAGKIDVTKIDKNRLFRGQKGTYLDVVVFLEDEADQYGNHGMIVEQVSKDEREDGVKGTVLGNVKIVSEGERRSPQQSPQGSGKYDEMSGSDDLPF